MPLIDTNTRTTAPLSNEKQIPLGRFPVLNGVYVGFVKDSSDIQRNGRLRVWIAELGTAPQEDQGWITVNYCSPFAGATNVDTISKADLTSFEGTQTSYGFWMVPPDINNQVLVMFINGDASKGIWIGSLYNQFMNNMVPAMAAGANTYQHPGKLVPTAEYNKWDTKVTQPDRALRPVETTKFKGLGNQGLIQDEARGITNTSARRESPSSVFGISTPGPAIINDVPQASIRRKGGSSLVMDDGVGSEYIQFATKSGAQIKLDETNGFVYIVNRDGTAWIEMDQTGNISIFSAKDISLRAQQDFNIRADRNINIEAGQNIYLKAAKDTNNSTTTFTYDVNNIPKTSTIPYYKYVGENNGIGGNIVVQALSNMHTTVSNDMFLTVDRDINTSISRNHFLTVNENSNYLVNGNFLLTTSGDQNYKSNNTFIGTDSSFNLKAANSILAESLSSINLKASGGILTSASSFDVSSGMKIGGDVQINTTLKVTASSQLGGSVQLGGTVITDTPSPPGSASSPDIAIEALLAEIKQLVEKINILATWSDPSSKFKRNAESLQTTLSSLPTFEPCPEHETFSFKSISGYTPTKTQASKTYEGSGGAGNEAVNSPSQNTTPGANNVDIPPTDANTSVLSKDFNIEAYECQIKYHEGVKYVSYLDSVGLPTGGIGHLLRQNEISVFPIPTSISIEQVSTWFQQDAQISIIGAQRLLGVEVWGELSDIRKRACADLCYNLGEGRLAKFTRFLSAMKVFKFDIAGQSLRDSKWFTQVGRRGPNIITMIVNDIDPTGCSIKFP
jgi:lysozyme